MKISIRFFNDKFLIILFPESDHIPTAQSLVTELLMYRKKHLLEKNLKLCSNIKGELGYEK